MNAPRPLERSVAAWMADEVAGVRDDALVDSILSATSRTRRTPRWLALLKEPPMRHHARVAVGSPTRRLVLISTTLLLLLAATVAVALATRPASDSDDWPGFLGGYDHAGVADQGPVGRPVVAWEFQAESGVYQAIAIVGDRVVVPTDLGVVHGLDRATGAERWRFEVDSGRIPHSALVAQGHAHATDSEGVVYALDLETGAEAWRSQPIQGTIAGPTYGDGALYFGTEPGGLVAIDAATGLERWRTPVPGANAMRSPAFSDGRVFAAVDSVGYLAFDAATGDILWTLPTGDDAMGSARVAGPIAFIGAQADAPAGRLRAVDAATGRELWNAEGNIGGPSTVDGVAYSGAPGSVAARDALTGAELWHADFEGYVRGVGVADGVVYAPADGEHRIYALDAATGGELWRYDLGEGNQCCIAVAGGMVFVGTDSGKVYAIGGDGTTLTPGPRPGVTTASSASPGAEASATPSEAAVTATLSWRANLPDGNLVTNSIAIAPDGRIWASDGFSDRFAVFSADGEFIEYWGESGSGPGQFELQRTNDDQVTSIAFAPDGSFHVLDGGNKRVQRFDADRRYLGEWGGFGDEPGQFQEPIALAVGHDGTVHVLDEVRGVIEQYDAGGNVLGTLDPFQEHRSGFATTASLAIDGEGNLYVSLGNPYEVVRLDPAGTITQVYGRGADGQALFADWPGQMSIDAAGRLFVNHGFGRGDRPAVLVFDRDGTYLGGWGQAGVGEGDLTFPSGILVDGGDVYIGDVAGAFEGLPGLPGLRKYRVEVAP